MAWTPPTDAVEVKDSWKPPTDAVEVKTTPKSKEEPGWFEPGSKSEAALRGFSQGATLGFGDEIQALVRSVGSDKSYSQLRDEERNANDAAAKANSGSYLAGNVAASLPQLGGATTLLSKGLAAVPARAGTTFKSLATGAMQTPTIGTAAKAGSLVGGVTGLGTGEGDVGDQLLNAGTGALVGGAGGAAGAGAARGVGMVGSSITGRTARGAEFVGPKYANPIIEGFKDRAGGAAVGAIGSAAVGGDPFYGAVGGAAVGSKKLGDVVNPISRVVQQGATKALEKLGPAMAKHAVQSTSQAGRAVSTTTAGSQALWDLSGRQKQEVRSSAEQQIQSAVEKGTPEYAAKFLAKQDPAYRVASQDGEDEPAEPEPARRGTMPRTGNFVPPDENNPTVEGMAKGTMAGLRAYGDEALMGTTPYLVAGPMVAANKLMGDGKMTFSDARESAQGVLDEDKKQYPGAVNFAGAASLAALPMGLPKKTALQAIAKGKPVNYTNSVSPALKSGQRVADDAIDAEARMFTAKEIREYGMGTNSMQLMAWAE